MSLSRWEEREIVNSKERQGVSHRLGTWPLQRRGEVEEKHRNFLWWGPFEKGLGWRREHPQIPTGTGIPHGQVFSSSLRRKKAKS